MLAFVIILIILLVCASPSVRSENVRNNPDYCKRINVVHYPAARNRITIGLIGGVHGDEPAGAVALQDLVNSGWFATMSAKTGLGFTIIPRANEHGLRNGTRRTQIFGVKQDLNRAFHMNERGVDIRGPLARQIIKALANTDIVLDFHEGWGFHKIQPKSLGSTLSPTAVPGGVAEKLARSAVEHINDDIEDSEKQFTYLPNMSCDIAGLLSCYMERIGKDYILMETSGQKNIQPLDVRKQQIQKTIAYIVMILNNR